MANQNALTAAHIRYLHGAAAADCRKRTPAASIGGGTRAFSAQRP